MSKYHAHPNRCIICQRYIPNDNTSCLKCFGTDGFMMANKTELFKRLDNAELMIDRIIIESMIKIYHQNSELILAEYRERRKTNDE